eukprot:SAG11_NODE_1664_length_4496_cov_1.786218_2_plen_159_part_00
MREVLRRSSTPYVAINQDDGVWEYAPEILGAPVQSLYHARRLQIQCDMPCGMVAMIFRRDVLRHFLMSIIEDKWKLKFIDWLLEDFIQANDYEWPAVRTVRHVGLASTADADDVRRSNIHWDHWQPSANDTDPALNSIDGGKRLFSCARCVTHDEMTK